MACTLEADLPQNTNGNDEVVVIVDIRRIRKKPERNLFPCRAREISISSVIVL